MSRATALLNSLHKKEYYSLVATISRIMYLVKGFGFVKVAYKPQFRAYEFKVKGISYFSIGPGWAYSFAYLKEILRNTFCYYYTPQPGDCVVDIGAGLGEETVVMAQQVGCKGKVYSLEANPTTFKAVKYVCMVNNFHWVKPMNLALYNKNELVTIEDDDENYLGNTINSSSQSKKTFEISGQTFDSFVRTNGIGGIDFLKVNIEGAEQFLIGHMHESAASIKNICISCHDFRHTDHNHGEFYVTREKVKAYLLSLNFEVTSRHTGNSATDNYLYAWKSTHRA